MTTTTGSSGLDALFRPRTIAVIGASDDPRKIGGRPIRYMLEAKTTATLYPVNPTRSEIQGLQAWPSAESIPGGIDQAIIAVPASMAEKAVADACAAKASAIVMFTGGFAEAGEEGAEAQRRIVELVRKSGARLLGPNSIGAFNTADRTFSTFATAMDRGTPEAGRIGLVSQSGAVGSYLQNLLINRGMAISKFVATGNEADIDVAECIEWMAHDPETEVIALYLEGCRNGPALLRALRVARETKTPVVVFKAGKTDAGQTAAASHTGALAGSAKVFDTALRETGALPCETLFEMVEAIYACSLGRLPKDNTVCVISVSGGFGVMLTDAAVEHGLSMPPISAETLATIQQELPLAVGLNPIDTTAQTVSDRTMLARTVERILRDRSYGSVVLFMANAGRNPHDVQVLRGPLKKLREDFADVQLALCVQTIPETRAELEQLGYLIFEDPTQAIKALAAASSISHGLRNPTPAASVMECAPLQLSDNPDEAQSKEILSSAGIEFAREIVAATADEAVAAAKEIGFPVVLKVLSAQIAHKSEVGGVALGLADEEAVREAFARVTGNAAKAVPDAEIRGVTVAQMVSGGTQTIIGGHIDPTFGPIVMFGLGGIYTEVLKDTVLRTAPVTHDDAIQMIRSIKTFSILDGARGQEKADLDAIARAIVQMSQFIATHADEVESAEINPFIALPKGGFGVDALIHLCNQH